MSSVQLIDTATEVTEGGIINRKDYFFLNKTQLSSIKAAEKKYALKWDLNVAKLSTSTDESWEVTGCIDGNMEDDTEATAQEVTDGCVGTLKKWSEWGRDRKLNEGTEVRKGRII